MKIVGLVVALGLLLAAARVVVGIVEMTSRPRKKKR